MSMLFRGSVALRLAFGVTVVSVAGCGASVVADTGDTGSTSTSTSTETTTNTSTSTETSTSTSTWTQTSTSTNTDEWTPLIDGTWSLTPGTESYWCASKTIQEDTYITAFRAKAPLGTHHTLLLRGGGGPDGESPCGPTLSADMYFASGVGTDDLVFPPGVAVKLPAGTQITLNLHLFNTTSAQMNGVSGTLVKRVPAAAVQQEAEMILAGPISISVPPNGSQTVEGKCAFPGTSTIATVWPHMHQYGTHMKVTYDGASGSKVLHDGDFSFGEQKNYPIQPVTVAPGETIRVQCTYQNPTSQTINWGDSSKAEMCFAGLYRYPALGPACQ